METKKKYVPMRQEDMTPEQVEKWTAFYKATMQRKRETQAEIREYVRTPEFQETVRQLREENVKRGTPYV